MRARACSSVLAIAAVVAAAATASAAVRNPPGFGTNVFPGNDDESTAPVTLPFTTNFFGNSYDAVYVNNNGNVTFDSPLFEYTPFDLTSTGHVIIAAFFGDVDTRVGNVVTYGADTVDGHAAFGVEWPAVGYYGEHTDLLNTFELILIDRSDTGAGNFDIEFNYDQIQWETGDASGGTGGLGGASARVGFSNGTGVPGTFFELAGSGVNSAFLDSSPGGLVNNSRSTVPGRYVFEVRNGNVGTGTLPLIVLPGITGSYLQYIFGEAWPRAFDTFTSPGDGFLDNLQLAPDGVNPLDPNDPTYYVDVWRDHGKQGIIDEIDMGCVFGHCAYRIQVYTPAFDFLENRGYEENVTLFPFAVDWRKSAHYNASLLLDEIDAVLAQTGAPQVNILAHSQGGLVMEAALSDVRSFGKVARVMTMGTPYLGATKALGVLDYGEPCQAEALGMCVLDNGEVQKLVKNFPGFLDLLPSREFYRVYPSAVLTLFDRNGDGVEDDFISYDDERAKLADRNLALIDQEAAFHDRVDYWFPADPAVELVRLVGSGVPTIQTVVEYLEEECSGILWWKHCGLKEKSQFAYGNGDGTVPLHSADLYDPLHAFDDRGGAINAYAPGVSHGDLVKHDETLTYAATFFAGAGGAAASAAPRNAAAALAPQDTGGLTFVPSLLAGTEILVKGAQYGLLTDAAGNRLGVPDAAAGVALMEIPGAVFNQATDTASSFVTLDGPYSGVWTATADGELQLIVRDYADDAIDAVASSPRIAVTAGAVLTLILDRPTDLGALAVQVDDDGDGTVDRTIPFRPVVQGSVAADVTPPVSQVTLQKSFDGTGAEVVTVTIAATDQGGSGVDRIEWALDASDTSGVYSAPFTVPAKGNLVVRAFDGAGNVESPYQVLPLSIDPFTCYRIKPTGKFTAVSGVRLVDRFGSTTVDVTKSKSLCTPTSVAGTDPSASDHADHLQAYQMKGPKFRTVAGQTVSNRFGTLVVDAKKPDRLLVPTAKSLSDPPSAPTAPAVDHFQCYKAHLGTGQPKFVPVTGVTVEDQFGSRVVDVTKPRRLCNPTDQNGGEPGAETHADHLMCYQVKPAATFAPVGPIFIANELDSETLEATRPDEVCVPSVVSP